MHKRTLRTCSAAGCPTLTNAGRCAKHELHRGRADAGTRGTASARGYDRAHRKWRAAVLRRNPLCVECLKVGRTTRATVADHIVPIRDGGSKRDLENGQGLCHPCHNRKTVSERCAAR